MVHNQEILYQLCSLGFLYRAVNLAERAVFFKGFLPFLSFPLLDEAPSSENPLTNYPSPTVSILNLVVC